VKKGIGVSWSEKACSGVSQEVTFWQQRSVKVLESKKIKNI